MSSVKVNNDEEERLEAADVALARSGQSADVVFIYPIEDDDRVKERNQEETAKAVEGVKAKILRPEWYSGAPAADEARGC